MLDEIRAFVVATFRHGRGQGIDETTPLVTSGIIDSAGVIQVVDWLEGHFHIALDDSEVGIENFNSLAALGALVLRKL